MSRLAEPIKTSFAKAMSDARGRPEVHAEILETLLTSLSMCIATQAKGNPKLMNELLEGASGYLFERAADFQKLGAFMGAIGNMPK